MFPRYRSPWPNNQGCPKIEQGHACTPACPCRSSGCPRPPDASPDRPSSSIQPPTVVLAASLSTLLNRGISIYILSRLGTIPALVYAVFCFLLELTALNRSPEGGYYLGKHCGGCLNTLFSRLFKNDAPTTSISPFQRIGLCTANFVPLAAGFLLLTCHFSWSLLLLTLILFSLAGICASLPPPENLPA